MRVVELRYSRLLIVGIAAAIGLTFMAAMITVAFSHPIAVLAAPLVILGTILLIRYPIGLMAGFLFLAPFHTALLTLVQAKAHLPVGPIAFWKDAAVVGLFLRAFVERVRKDRRPPLRNPGDSLLLFYILASIAMAILSPSRPTVGPALARYVEGPLLLLAILWLRPSRRDLWLFAGAMVAAAAVIGAAAVIERLGPQLRFQRWYGATPGPDGQPFLIGKTYRSGSFIYDPLVLGFYLAGATALAMAAATLRSRWRTAALVCLAACVGGLIVTLTRSAYIGGGIGALVALSLIVRNPGIRLSLVGLCVVITGTVALYYAAAGSPTLLREKSNTAHQDALERDIELLEARPFGYGFGTTDRYRFRAGAGPGQLGATESTYFARALESGVHGLALYLIVLFANAMRLRAARRTALAARDRPGTALAAGALGAMLAVVLAGLFLGVHELVVEMVLWGPVGIALAWGLAEKRADESEELFAPPLRVTSGAPS